jgi:hypothetical protein
VQVGLLRLPADQLHAYLAGSVSGRWQDIASYEKTLLGVPTSKGVSEGWSGYQQAISAYHKANPGSTIVRAQLAGLATQIDKTYPGFAKDWQLSQTPKVIRFQQTNLYQTMTPAVRQLFDANIAGPAKQTAAAIKQNGHATYYTGEWRKYIEAPACRTGSTTPPRRRSGRSSPCTAPTSSRRS